MRWKPRRNKLWNDGCCNGHWHTHIFSLLHNCLTFLLILAPPPQTLRAVSPQVRIYSFCPKSFYKWTQKHNVFVFQDSRSCLFTPPCISFFSPLAVYRRVRSISAVIRVVSCCVVCMCICVRVCHVARLHKLLYQPSVTLLSRLLLSPLIFPILSHTGPHMLLLPLSRSLFINVHTIPAPWHDRAFK